jgi:hypothetical protein
MKIPTPPPAGPCRLCGDQSWLVDDTGPVHLCCGRELRGNPQVTSCSACAAAKSLRQRERRSQT